VNRQLSPWIKGFSQRLIHGAAALFTLRLLGLSHMGTASFKLETLA
jgi:hypothetical protein